MSLEGTVAGVGASLLFAGVGGTALAVALACGRAAEQARDAALAVVAKLDRALADEHAARVAQAHALAGGRRAAHRLALVQGKLEAAEAAARGLKHALSQAETRALGFQVGSDTRIVIIYVLLKRARRRACQ